MDSYILYLNNGINVLEIIGAFMGLFLLGIISLIFRIIIMIYIYKDANKKGSNGIVWSIGVFFFPLISVILYLLLVYKNSNLKEEIVDLSQHNNTNNTNNTIVNDKPKKPILLISYIIFEIITSIILISGIFSMVSNVIEESIEHKFYNQDSIYYHYDDFDDYNDFDDFDDFWD